MFYSVDGKIVEVGGDFLERKVNSLTFQVVGTQFPDYDIPDINDERNHFYFDSDSPNSVTVNWGDGVTETFLFGTDSGGYRIGWKANGLPTSNSILQGDALAGRHIYEDGNDGLRTITFEFENLNEILVNVCSFTRLYNAYPSELGFAKKLNEIFITTSKFLTGLPDSLSKIRNIKSVRLARCFVEPLNKIPDGFFTNKLTELSIGGSFNLSDSVSSNFFKINQLKNYLTKLVAPSCNIEMLPDSLEECINLTTLTIENNNILNPEVISKLYNLSRLYLTTDPSVNYMFDTTDLNDLVVLLYSNLSFNLISDIPLKWTGLKSLKSFVVFNAMVNYDNIYFDAFIDSFYALCAENGFLEPTSQTAIDTGYPNQFRDVSWGHSSLTQTGEIQAPAGFVQGVDNGAPANQGEKIYVLVNNYGHNVTTSGNFN